MKKFKQIFTLLISVIILFSFVGCGNTQNGGGDSNTVELYYWNSGLGLDFMKKIVDDFNAKQDEYFVDLEHDSSGTTIQQTLNLGSSNNYDLYLTMLNSMQYKNDMIKLDDVLDSKADGGTMTIREKYYPALLNGVKDADGTTNFLTYGNGWAGIVYNTDLVKDVPLTTNELNQLCMDLEVKPWLFFNANGPGYWSYPLTAWQAQYDGLDYYNNNMMQLKDENGVSPSKEVLFRKDGRYEALKVASQILTTDTIHEQCTNTDHTAVQEFYLDGEAAMMVNGCWLLSESSGTANVKMMKIPVISSIVNKLENKKMTDSNLSKIVAQVDAGATSSEYCSANDFARIKQARNLMYNNGSEQYVFIPKYSNAIEGSKAFLRYFYSDEALITFIEHTGISNAAKLEDLSKFDSNKLTEWGKQQYEFSNELIAITGLLNKADIFLNTGLDSFIGINYPLALSANNPVDRKTVDQLWNMLQNKVNENWEEWSS